MMSPHPRAASLIGLLALVFVFGPTSPAGSQPSGDAGTPVALNILYTSDVKGHIEPCG